MNIAGLVFAVAVSMPLGFLWGRWTAPAKPDRFAEGGFRMLKVIEDQFRRAQTTHKRKSIYLQHIPYCDFGEWTVKVVGEGYYREYHGYDPVEALWEAVEGGQ